MTRLATIALVGAIAFVWLSSEMGDVEVPLTNRVRGKHNGAQPHLDKDGNREHVEWAEVAELKKKVQ